MRAHCRSTRVTRFGTKLLWLAERPHVVRLQVPEREVWAVRLARRPEAREQFFQYGLHFSETHLARLPTLYASQGDQQ
jgi:hypothetical protein